MRIVYASLRTNSNILFVPERYTVNYYIGPETRFKNIVGRADILPFPTYLYLISTKLECIAAFNILRINRSLLSKVDLIDMFLKLLSLEARHKMYCYIRIYREAL